MSAIYYIILYYTILYYIIIYYNILIFIIIIIYSISILHYVVGHLNSNEDQGLTFPALAALNVRGTQLEAFGNGCSCHQSPQHNSPP